MRALSELRDPVAVAFAAATALAAIWLGHDLVAIATAMLAVLLARVGVGVALRRQDRAGAAPLNVGMRSANWYAPLTRREADVAELIRDMTNKEIGERLVLSERTIDSHIRNIMNRLDLHHRAQIAAWVAERSTVKPDSAATPAPPRDRRF
jgi:DNA-binding NarL/FixJ family response regulator